MTCERCHERIESDEGYDMYFPGSGSTAAPTVYLHKRDCQPVLRQTAPSGIGA